jgi:hypothetical protein
MKHFTQTIIHNELFVEDDWGRISAISLGDVQKLHCRLKNKVARNAVRVMNFSKKEYLTEANIFSC